MKKAFSWMRWDQRWKREEGEEENGKKSRLWTRQRIKGKQNRDEEEERVIEMLKEWGKRKVIWTSDQGNPSSIPYSVLCYFPSPEKRHGKHLFFLCAHSWSSPSPSSSSVPMHGVPLCAGISLPIHSADRVHALCLLSSSVMKNGI